MNRVEGRAPLRPPGRTAGTANLMAAVTLLALLVPALLSAGTQAPPAAAEFSPSADQVIEEAPQDQAAAVNGTGQGEAPADGGPTGDGEGDAPAAAEAEPTVEVAADQVKQCVGPPPLRQIEDPQSPPCIAYWDGDNGGATWRGVTQDTIHVAIPTPEGSQAHYEALRSFFNNRFQFYGRQMVFQYCSSSGGGRGSTSEANQQADAALVAGGCDGDGIVPFASAMYRELAGVYYHPAVACRYGIISVSTYQPFDSTYLDRCPGLLYQYPMVADEIFANIGEWSCKRLAGRTAEWADGQSTSVPPQPMNTLTRNFGVLLEPFTDDDPIATRASLSPIVDRLNACGAEVSEDNVIVSPVQGNYDPGTAQNAVLQLRSNGVTTIICMCNFQSFGTLQRAADANTYYPEWVTSSYGINDVESSFTLAAAQPTQMERTFGITVNPPVVDPLVNPFNIALMEADPSQAPVTDSFVQGKLEVYRSLLVLASGIQMAGPNLTPDTFRDGLRAARFPNPLHPLRAGDVAVRPNGYAFTSDAAEWWWSTEASGPFTDSRPGTTCYIDRGVNRYGLGEWPEGDAPFFDGSCEQ